MSVAPYLRFVPLLLVCLGPLAFVMAKTSALERDMRIAATENMLWVVTQTRMEVMALTLAAAEADPARVERRFDLTLSRLTLLREGPQARYLARLGHGAAVDGIADALLRLDPVEHGHGPALHAGLHALGQELHPTLNRIANDVMTHEWALSAQRLDAYRATQRRVLLAVGFAFLAALAISALLLRNQRRLLAAEVQRLHAAGLLARERDTSAMYRDFAAMVSHQMRTPLSLIDSALHRLARRGADVTARDVAERRDIVRDAVRRLTRLVDTVLLLGRLDNRQLSDRRTAAALERLACAAIEEARLRHPGRTVNLSQAGAVPRARCDPDLVAHILDNLLSNALKYAPPDTPVEVRVFPRSGRVACAVTDRGPGVDARDRPHVFERYYRGHRHRAGQGTGLGLALARELAVLQGGDVTLDSWPGRGSVFTLWLPAMPGGAMKGEAMPGEAAP